MKLKFRRHFSFSVIIICALVVCSVVSRVQADEETSSTENETAIRIYLPREITVKDSNLVLGQVSVILGTQELVEKAEKVTLGSFCLPGQEIVIKKHIILSRLSSNGILSPQVTLRGAEEVAIKQKQQIVTSDDFARLAESFLEKNPPQSSISRYTVIRKPKDFIISDANSAIRYVPRLVRNDVSNQAKITVDIYSGQDKIGASDVTFALKYNVRAAIAKVDIPTGTLISTENTKIEQKSSSFPEPDDWQSPYGLVAKRTIRAGTVISSGMIGKAELPVIIKRNQNVVIKVEVPGILVTASGQALQDGKAGEFIKVRNTDSQRIILAKINQDMTVEPVF